MRKNPEGGFRLARAVPVLIHEPAQELHGPEGRVESGGRLELFQGRLRATAFQVDGAKRRAHPGGLRRGSTANLGGKARFDPRDGGIPFGQAVGHRVEGSGQRRAFIATRALGRIDEINEPLHESVFRLRVQNRRVRENGEGERNGKGGNAEHAQGRIVADRARGPTAAGRQELQPWWQNTRIIEVQSPLPMPAEGLAFSVGQGGDVRILRAHDEHLVDVIARDPPPRPITDPDEARAYAMFCSALTTDARWGEMPVGSFEEIPFRELLSAEERDVIKELR